MQLYVRAAQRAYRAAHNTARRCVRRLYAAVLDIALIATDWLQYISGQGITSEFSAV